MTTSEMTETPPADRHWLLRHARLFAAIGFALVVLAGGGAILLTLRGGDTDALIAHTYDVRETAKNLLIALQDAETSQRGFLLTGDEKYLDRFGRSVVSASGDQKRLVEATSDNPVQQARLAKINPWVDERIDIIRQTIALARTGKRDAAVALVQTDRGENLMNNVRDTIAPLLATELDLLQAHQAYSATLRLWLMVFIAVCLLAALTLGALLARSTQYYIARLRERTSQLEVEGHKRAEMEDTLRQAQKLEAIGQLSGGIAHDFNNLLTIIIGNLETLKRRLAAPADGSAHAATLLSQPLDMAMRGARSAAQLTHRLLAYARRQPLKPERLELNRQVAGMSELLRHTLGEAINIETVLAAGLWPAFVDGNQVENAILNLAINARDAMPNGGRLTIETANVSLDEAYASRFGDVSAGQYVMLSVTDTGTGIAPELMKNIFEPFFTTKPAGEGSGLGLAMVHGFVKQTGGHVRIYSEVGQGTSVKVYLPRLVESEDAASAPATRAPAPASGGALPQETILVVEDNDGVRAYAKSVLEEIGYHVIEAGRSDDALRIIAGDGRIDLLFTDVILPGGMTGRVLADRAAEYRKDLPVLFTTGYTRNAIVHHGRLDAGVHLLGKPYTRPDLVQKVREILDRHGAATDRAPTRAAEMAGIQPK
jgi:signal transduction histidine kinase/FixJ family two-component response regulator